MTGWVIFLIILALFLLMKVGVRFQWDSGTSLLKIRVGFIRFALPTGEKKTQKKKPAKEQSPAAEMVKKEKKPMNPSLKSWIKAVLECWRDLIALIGKVLRSPTLDLLQLYIDVGGKDAGDCALTYGRICAGVSAALPALHNSFRVKKQDIQVACRYDRSKVEIAAEVEATVMIYEIFALIGTVLGLLIKLYMTKKRNDKAVQQYETSSS